jgi:hypothetical protein
MDDTTKEIILETIHDQGKNTRFENPISEPVEICTIYKGTLDTSQRFPPQSICQSHCQSLPLRRTQQDSRQVVC